MTKIKKFENEVRFVYEKIPHVRTISLGIWINNGSIHENENENGISHFIEHMLFKGTKNRTQVEIAEAIDNVGAIQNAFTSKEATCYYINALDSYFDLSIEVLSDMFFNSVFNEEEIEKERKVIEEEIKMYEDLPDDLVVEQMNSSIYNNKSFGKPILGTVKSLKNIKRENFIDFLNRRYTGNNIVISLAGNFEEDYVLEKTEKIFGSKIIGNKDNLIVEKPIYNREIILTNKKIEQAHLLLTYDAFDIFNKKSIDTKLFSSIFGGSQSSVLNQIVREKYGYAYSIFTSSVAYQTCGLFSVYAGLNKKNVNHVIEIVNEEFSKYLKTSVSDEKLKNTKEQFKSQLLMSLENTSNCMSRNGKNMITKGKILSIEETISEIDNVTINSLNETLEILYTEKPSISLVGDLKGITVS
ncbi:MAG: M16 family metallopeptidase [Lachnospirales bacterium]